MQETDLVSAMPMSSTAAGTHPATRIGLFLGLALFATTALGAQDRSELAICSSSFKCADDGALQMTVGPGDGRENQVHVDWPQFASPLVFAEGRSQRPDLSLLFALARGGPLATPALPFARDLGWDVSVIGIREMLAHQTLSHSLAVQALRFRLAEEPQVRAAGPFLLDHRSELPTSLASLADRSMARMDPSSEPGTARQVHDTGGLRHAPADIVRLLRLRVLDETRIPTLARQWATAWSAAGDILLGEQGLGVGPAEIGSYEVERRRADLLAWMLCNEIGPWTLTDAVCVRRSGGSTCALVVANPDFVALRKLLVFLEIPVEECASDRLVARVNTASTGFTLIIATKADIVESVAKERAITLADLPDADDADSALVVTLGDRDGNLMGSLNRAEVRFRRDGILHAQLGFTDPMLATPIRKLAKARRWLCEETDATALDLAWGSKRTLTIHADAVAVFTELLRPHD